MDRGWRTRYSILILQWHFKKYGNSTLQIACHMSGRFWATCHIVLTSFKVWPSPQTYEF
jgi:hypothetical protein